MYFDLFDEDTEGARPDRLFEVRPQERDQRRTVEQIVDTAFFVPSLDVLDVHIPEQVIEVPKISSPSRPCRRRVRFAEQTAEQLVEVPTIVPYSLLQRTVEQNVVIPVPDRGGRNVGLQGFPPRQSSTAQLASQERSSERIVEEIVDSRVLGGGLQDFHPVQGSSASSLSSREHAGEGFFRTFPRVKKSPKVSPHSGSELSADFDPSTLSAHQMAPSGLLWSQGALRWSTTTGMRGCVWTLRGARFGRNRTLGINSGARPGSTEVPQIQFIDVVVVEAELEYIIMRQSVPWVYSRSSHLENGALFSCFLYLSAVPRCLGVACGKRHIGFFGR